MNFISVTNQKNLIHEVKVHKLTMNRDPRGFLVETLKETWEGIFERPEVQFGQSYCSMTLPGFARDEDRWHYHPTKQIDRFHVMKGNAIFALYDWRKESPTYKQLNMFLMGEINGDDNQFLLFIPQNVLHAFCTIGKEPCYLLGYPSQTYDAKEEGRVLFTEVGAVFPDQTPFSWNPIRNHFKTTS